MVAPGHPKGKVWRRNLHGLCVQVEAREALEPFGGMEGGPRGKRVGRLSLYPTCQQYQVCHMTLLLYLQPRCSLEPAKSGPWDSPTTATPSMRRSPSSTL